MRETIIENKGIILRWELYQSRRCILLRVDILSLLLLLLIFCLLFIPLVK